MKIKIVVLACLFLVEHNVNGQLTRNDSLLINFKFNNQDLNTSLDFHGGEFKYSNGVNFKIIRTDSLGLAIGASRFHMNGNLALNATLLGTISDTFQINDSGDIMIGVKKLYEEQTYYENGKFRSVLQNTKNISQFILFDENSKLIYESLVIDNDTISGSFLYGYGDNQILSVYLKGVLVEKIYFNSNYETTRREKINTIKEYRPRKYYINLCYGEPKVMMK